MASPNDNASMALFCDFENVALGVRDANYEKFDIKPVLERLLLKGSIEFLIVGVADAQCDVFEVAEQCHAGVIVG